MSSTFFFSNLFAWDCGSGWTGGWGRSMSYECTLGDWMFSKIDNNQIGGKEEHSRGVKLQWPPTTLIMEIWGRSTGSLVEPLAISTNVSERAVSDEKLTTNHCDTCNALKIVCLCLLNMKRAKITWIWRKSVPDWLKLTVSFSRVANYM